MDKKCHAKMKGQAQMDRLSTNGNAESKNDQVNAK